LNIVFTTCMPATLVGSFEP